MKAYTVQINSIVQPGACTTLLHCCDKYDLPYSSASKGKRVFVKENVQVYIITEIEIIKNKRKK